MKEYFARFKYLYITLVVILVVTIAATAVYMTKQKAAAANKGKRMNTECLTDERVFDYADVLTDAQEDDLRELIAEKEKEVSLDIVLVTLNEDVGSSDDALMEYADQFYEDNKFGYDKPIGDGVIYVDNYYDRYVWFGTTGIAENAYTTSAINNLLDAVCDLTDADPYEAYKTYVMQVAGYMAEREAEDSIGIMVDPFSIMIIALIVAVSYVLVNLKKQEGKRTTTASTYVERTPGHEQSGGSVYDQICHEAKDRDIKQQRWRRSFRWRRWSSCVKRRTFPWRWRKTPLGRRAGL